MLVEEGLIARRRGAGTFVLSPETPLVASFLHAQFLDEERGRVLPVFARAPKRDRAPAAGPWSAYLSGEGLCSLERAQSVNREFSVYARLFFDAARFPGLAAVDLRTLAGASLKDALSRELGAQVTRHSHRLKVGPLPAEICRALGLRARVAGGVLEVVAYDRMGAALYFQDFHIPPNKRRLVVTA
jgi:DNA-binding GntR family transcriptional regulator